MVRSSAAAPVGPVGHWTPTSNAPVGDYQGVTAAVNLAGSSKIFVLTLANGTAAPGSGSFDQIYDPATGQFTPRDPIPDTLRMAASAGGAGDYSTVSLTALPDGTVLYHHGGKASFLYNPADRSWKVTRFSSHLYYHNTATPITGTPATCGVNCGKVLFVGIDNLSGSPMVNAELYDPTVPPGSNPWTLAATPLDGPAGPLTDQSAVALGDGRVLVVAGTAAEH